MIPRLSETTQRLLMKFYAPRGWFNRSAKHHNRQDILKQIELSGEVAAIPALLHIFVNENRELQQAAARAMYTLFQGLAPADFAEFDETVRRSSWSSWNYGQSTLLKAPKNLQSLTIFAGYSNFLLGMFSCHADGYAREAALRALGDCATGEELPFFLLRANDWVENVRNVAKEQLQGRIREPYIPHFLNNLPLVLRLNRAGRQNHEGIVGRIQGLLATPEALASIEEGMCSSDGITRRFCYGIALRAKDPRKLSLVAHKALNETNFRISLDALRAIARAHSSPELKEIVDVALRSAVASVRLSALRVALERFPESADAECRRALLDRNFGVRQQAQYHLQKSGSLNVCEYYAEVLPKASYKALPNVIAGIGETCSKAQSALLEPYLSSPRSELRMRAYRAVTVLDRDYPVDSFLKGLEDESAKVVRTAALFLRKRVNLIGGDRIWEIHVRLKSPRHRRWTLFLIAGLMKWDACYFLIRGLNDVNSEVSTLARKYFERWGARHSFVAPSVAQREKLQALIDENQHLLTSHELLHLRGVLKAS